MAASVREQILAQLVTAFGGMSTGAGYENDYPGGVHRFQQAGTALKDPPTVVVTMMQDQKDHGSETVVVGRLEVAVEVFAVHPDGLGDSTGTYLDSLAQDVERAVEADTTLAGLATHAFVENVRPFGLIDGLPYVGVACRVVVQYRHRRGEPDEVA